MPRAIPAVRQRSPALHVIGKKLRGMNKRQQIGAGIIILLVLGSIGFFYNRLSAATFTSVPDATVAISSWSPVGASSAHLATDEGTTAATSDYIETGTASDINTVDLDLSSPTNVSSVTQLRLWINARSATNANGGTLDSIGMNLTMSGSSIGSATVTPAHTTSSIWNWYSTSAISGSWSQAQIDSLQADFSRTVLGSGNPAGQRDNVQIATVYVEVTYTPTMQVGQAAYRFYNNADSVTPGTPLAAENVAANVAPETPFRLRQRLAIDGDNLAQSGKNFKLQYAEKAGVCDPTDSYTDMYIPPPSTVVKGGGAFTQLADVINGENWTNIANVESNDGLLSSVTGTPGVASSSNTLAVSAYGFSTADVPDNATISGIEVSGEFSALLPTSTTAVGSVKLLKGGAPMGVSRTASLTGLASTVGGPTDLWGTTWTPSEINSTGFGAGLSAVLNAKSNATQAPSLRVDYMFIKVYYKIEPVSAAVMSYHDNASVAHNASISLSAIDPTNNGRTAQYQTYLESDPFTNSVSAVTNGSDGLWDFALTSSAASNGKTYCLRVVSSDSSSLGSYTYYPEITFGAINPTGPTLEQQLRGGQGVVNGVKSPFKL